MTVSNEERVFSTALTISSLSLSTTAIILLIFVVSSVAGVSKSANSSASKTPQRNPVLVSYERHLNRLMADLPLAPNLDKPPAFGNYRSAMNRPEMMRVKRYRCVEEYVPAPAPIASDHGRFQPWSVKKDMNEIIGRYMAPHQLGVSIPKATFPIPPSPNKQPFFSIQKTNQMDKQLKTKKPKQPPPPKFNTNNVDDQEGDEDGELEDEDVDKFLDSPTAPPQLDSWDQPSSTSEEFDVSFSSNATIGGKGDPGNRKSQTPGPKLFAAASNPRKNIFLKLKLPIRRVL